MMNKNEKNNGRVRQILKKTAAFSMTAFLAGAMIAGTVGAASEASAEDTKLLLAAEESVEEGEEAKEDLTVSEIAEKALPSVVSISTKSMQEVQDYYSMFGFYGGYAPSQREVQGSGSGIIIGKNDSELLIVTNYHVIEGATEISVSFADNAVVAGVVKGFEPGEDLAVVAVNLDDIETETLREISIATIGSSDDIRVGEQVVAIGNAMGYGQSVTTGIVSAKNRTMNGATGYMSDVQYDEGLNLIQTDAAINPGNSGGALLNMKGEVIGINSAKLASTTVEGMGYAIAISDVSETLEYLMNMTARDQLAEDEHGIIGITGSTVDQTANQRYGLPMGVWVREVAEGGAAEKAGIPVNAIITKFDRRTISSINDLVDMLTYYAPGEEVEVVYQVPGENGYEEKTATVTLTEQTEDYRAAAGITSGDEESDDDRRAPEEDGRYEEDYGQDGYGYDYDNRSRDDILNEWDNYYNHFFGY